MMRPRSWIAAIAAALLVLAGLALLLAPPPPVAVLPGDGPAPPRGAVHVHTTRSDGAGTVDEVAAAAAAAGLDFVILTDHGDSLRDLDPPAYHAGVLVIDAREIGTYTGHVVALETPRADYPLAGEARDVVEDIQRLGGFAIAAHPASARERLRWTDWDVPVDGLEWLNGDSSWRDEGVFSLAAALLAYPVRPAGALERLLDRPDEALAAWDRLLASRRVVALAAVDAHGRIALGGGETSLSFAGVPAPSYASTFGLLSVGRDGVTLTGDAEADARAVLDALRAGHVFSAVDALAGPGVVRLTTSSGGTTYAAGDLVPLDGPLEIVASVDGPPDARIELRRDGAVVSATLGRELRYNAPSEPGVYRVEVSLPDAPGTPPVPWLLSNPLYVGRMAEVPPAAPAPPVDPVPAAPEGEWVIEKSPASDAAIDAVTAPGGGPETLLRFAVSGRASDSPYVAFRVPVAGVFADRDRLAFTVRADQPLRVDVQLRSPTPLPGETGPDPVLGERWHRSVYADTDVREVVIPFDDLRPKGPTSTPLPDPAAVDSLLFVLDTVNTPAGTGGRVYVSNLRFGTSP